MIRKEAVMDIFKVLILFENIPDETENPTRNHSQDIVLAKTQTGHFSNTS
jgi:hypothetical protein